VNITTEGAPVNIVLYRDLTGRWRRESDGEERDVEMREVTLVYGCPDTPLYANGFSPLGSLCVEADDTLSLCKTHAPECDTWIDNGDYGRGWISPDGRQVEITGYVPRTGRTWSDVYVRVD
jgi:hypothetical protein